MAMLQSDTIEERILYWLSLDLQVRALAERLLQRFAVTVGDLPASAAHHHAEPGGLYRHSLEVALKALEEFEGNMKMERRPDGSVDSFRSSRNRPRWQYATFIAAVCHDLGKLFDLEVRGKGNKWCPIHEPYGEFAHQDAGRVLALRPTARRTRLVLAGPSSSCRFLRRRGLPRRTATVAPVLVSGGRPQQGNCKSAFADGQPRRPSQRRAGPACHRRPARQQGQPVVAGLP